VAGVVTAPDKAAGRGQKFKPSPVKQFAQAEGIPILQPTNLKDPQFLEALEHLKPDLQVVVAFRKLPRVVWVLPPQGTFNLHASLLPDYRGAAPIHRAIINGETTTGVTTFFLNETIDNGSIIFQEQTAIDENQTAGELHDQLSELGAELVVKTVRAIQEGAVQPQTQQTHASAKRAPKIFREDTQINWEWSLEALHNFIRGLSPYPAARTYWAGKQFKILQSKKLPATHNHQFGTVVTNQQDSLHVAVKGGWLALEVVQLAGKQKMPVEAFLNGVTVPEDLVLGA